MYESHLVYSFVCPWTVGFLHILAIMSDAAMKICIYKYRFKSPGFPGGSEIKNPPPMQETQVGSLGQEDPPEKKMEIHSSGSGFLSGKSHGQRSLVGLQSMGVTKSLK